MAFPFLRVLCATALIGASLVTGPALAEGRAGAYLAARQAAYQSDYSAAADYTTRALARDPSNPQLLESAALAFLSLGQIERALPVARKIRADGLQSQIAQMILVAGHAQTGDYDALLGLIDDGHGVGPLVDGLISAWARIGQGRMSDALAAFDAVAGERGLASFALYHKALALASVGDFEGAEAVYGDPDTGPIQMTRRGALSRVEVLSQLERNDAAIDLIDRSFGGDLDPGLKALRARLVAGDMVPFTHVASAREGIAEVFYTIGGALQNEANPDYTLLYARLAEFLRPDHIDAILLSATLLEELENYDLATEAYRRVPTDDEAFHAAELGRAEALRESGRVESAVEVLEQLARSHGDLPVVHTSLGDILRQQKDYAGAAEAYDRALALYPETEASQWFVFYARGIAHERLDEWASAEADFRKALELNPDQPQVLNYLGYSLVEKNIKLDEALAMIQTAVQRRPDSGYIVDSLGWVLYRLGRYHDAVAHMERATELMPVDPIVNDHLGDVYWAVGRQREAEFQWERALSFDPEEKDASRIRRKLEVGLDQVLADEGAKPLKVANDDG